MDLMARRVEERIVVRVDREIEELIPSFLANRRRDVAAILEALDNRDFESILRLGHSMKGMGGGFGFDAITDFGREIESSAGERLAGRIRELTVELDSYLDRVQVVFAD